MDWKWCWWMIKYWGWNKVIKRRSIYTKNKVNTVTSGWRVVTLPCALGRPAPSFFLFSNWMTPSIFCWCYLFPFDDLFYLSTKPIYAHTHSEHCSSLIIIKIVNHLTLHRWLLNYALDKYVLIHLILNPITLDDDQNTLSLSKKNQLKRQHPIPIFDDLLIPEEKRAKKDRD